MGKSYRMCAAYLPGSLGGSAVHFRVIGRGYGFLYVTLAYFLFANLYESHNHGEDYAIWFYHRFMRSNPRPWPEIAVHRRITY